MHDKLAEMHEWLKPKRSVRKNPNGYFTDITFIYDKITRNLIRQTEVNINAVH